MEKSVKDCPRLCSICSKRLCLRQQVVNLALGSTDSMSCLVCLGEAEGTTAESVLRGMIDYISSRECFSKEWLRYETVAECPDPEGCLPTVCFKSKD